MLLIRNAELYTPRAIIKGASVLVENKKIKRIVSGRQLRVSKNIPTIDAARKIVSPGFIDVHLQGAGGFDFLDAAPQAIAKISQTLAKLGTTSFLATTVFKNGSNKHIEAITENLKPNTYNRIGAQLLGIHLEGPFVNPAKKGMIRPNGITGCSLAYLGEILNITKGRLKMMTIAPELKGAVEIIKKLRRKKILASFGHSDASFEQAQKGIAAGITHATHIFNAMRPLNHRDPGPLAAILTDDKVSVQLISDGVHIHPAIIKLIIKLKGIKNIILITDSMSSLGLPDGKYVYDGWEYESRNGACRYKDGTLIGTALPLNKMIHRMVKFGGVSLLEAIQMATINPARVLGISHRKGAIEEGKDADLVIMGKNLDVDMTIVGGKIVYRKGEKP